MDAAHTYFKSTVLFLATALLMVATGRAQPTLVLNGGTNTLSNVSLGTVPAQVTVAASDGSAILFGATITDTSTKPTGVTWLGITTGSNGYNTPTILYLSVIDTAGMQNGQIYAATIALTSSGPSGTIGVTFTFGSTSSGTLTPSATSVSLSAASGSATSAQVTLTNNTGNQVAFYIPTPTTTTGGAWLGATASTYTVIAGNSSTLTITAPNGLVLSNGTYYGTVVIAPSGGGGATTTINVTFYVGTGVGTGNLTATPNPVSWTFTSGSGVYPSTTVTLTSTTGATTYSDTVSSADPWLDANYTTSSNSINISSGIVLSPGPAFNSLATGSYTGQVSVTASDLSTVTITVNLVVNGGTTNGISWSPNPATITAAVGGSTQQVTVSLTSSTAGAFSSPSIGGSGLTVSGVTTSSSTAAYVIVYGNPYGLSANTYPGTLLVYFTPTGGTQVSQQIPISFVVGSSGVTTTSGSVTPTSLTFAYESGTTVTASTLQSPQYIVVSGAGTFSVAAPVYPSGETTGWLTATPSGSTAPGTIAVSVNPAGLSVGTYTATVAVTPFVGASATTVTVTLQVTSNTSPVVVAYPGSFNFTYNSGSGITSAQMWLYASDGSNMPLTVTPTQTWLTVTGQSSSTTPSVVTVSVSNLLTLANGVYTGSVTVNASGAANGTVYVPVVLTVTGSTTTSSGSLTLNPTSMTFNATQNGAAPATQALSVTASTLTYYTANASSSSNWLNISPSGNSLNTTSNPSITVSVNQSGLTAAGSPYSGTITLGANGINQTVNVTLTVTSTTTTGNTGNVTVTANGVTGTPSLTFTYQVGGSASGSQTLQVVSASGSGNISFTISSSASWLSAGVQNGATLLTPMNNPGFTVALVTPINLAAGQYSATITITPNGGTVVTVPVALTVIAAPTVTATPTTLSFAYQAGSANPTPGTVNVSGGGLSLSFSATVTSGSNWLSVSPTSGTTPTTGTAPLTVTVTPGTLGAGSYVGSITVSGTGTATGSTSITVNLSVTAPLPTINSVVNAASFISGKVSPGELVTLFGTAMGPAAAAYASIDPTSGKLATTIGGVQVLFNGIAAPMIYASATQISAVVPYEMAPIASPSVWVKYVGQTSNAYQLTSATTAPGIFTQNSSGNGPGAILNQDNSVNGPNNPAIRGSIVQIFMTGEGQTSPQGVTGSITTATLPPPQVTPAPLLPIGVTINGPGNPALWVYAGEAPGLVAGVMQLNVQIPINASSGNLPIVVSIGGNSSQANVTVSVR
jgi:uncharacterized protein (TIGR03437 family)